VQFRRRLSSTRADSRARLVGEQREGDEVRQIDAIVKDQRRLQPPRWSKSDRAPLEGVQIGPAALNSPRILGPICPNGTAAGSAGRIVMPSTALCEISRIPECD